MDDNDENFSLIDETTPQKLIVAYEDANIKELKREISRLNAKIDRIHYINLAARVGYVLFNPTFHLQNASKDMLYRAAFYIARQFA